jgi:hypothetical protein
MGMKRGVFHSSILFFFNDGQELLQADAGFMTLLGF